MEAVKKHRKGMKAQLETMLNNASKLQAEEVRRQAMGIETNDRVLQFVTKKKGLGRRRSFTAEAVQEGNESPQAR